MASTKAVQVVQSLRFVQIVQAVVGVDSARLFDREKGLLRKIDAAREALLHSSKRELVPIVPDVQVVLLLCSARVSG